MPLMPPGNRLFDAYFDASNKLQAKYVGPDPIVCAKCRRETYQTQSGRCPWCRQTTAFEVHSDAA